MSNTNKKELKTTEINNSPSNISLPSIFNANLSKSGFSKSPVLFNSTPLVCPFGCVSYKTQNIFDKDKACSTGVCQMKEKRMLEKIEIIESSDTASWDEYVHKHPKSTLYHLSGWKRIIEKTYGHDTHYLMASTKDKEKVLGVLPLVHLKHFRFGNQLVSVPFFDMGGLLADDEEIERELISEAIRLGDNLKVDYLELRHTKAISCLDSHQNSALIQNLKFNTQNLVFQTWSHKVRMLLELPGSSEMLMKSFKSKLRSQIKKPIREGLNAKVGGPELINDFYNVFATRMRCLGSPVHSKHLMQNVIKEFNDQSKIVVVYKDKQPVAGSLVAGFKDILENPWSSALIKYSRLSPNMLLYWTMLEYACDNGYKYFDFGRSTPGNGTYRFKDQWGAKPATFYWHYISLKGKRLGDGVDYKDKYAKAIKYWKKLPVGVTKVIGPSIRKYISL